MKALKQLIKKVITRPPAASEDGSLGITDKELIQKFIDDPNFPFLISFPRTGSHWLRMVMELYFERPSLVRAFYYKESKDFLTLHTHDIDLDLYRRNVIYLYRNPCPTIYSQMMYYKEDLKDEQRVRYWSVLYGKHLAKWLFEETVSQQKTILRYENLVQDIGSEFAKLTTHFGTTLDRDKLQQASESVSKPEVKKKTEHNQQVMNVTHTYEDQRQDFLNQYANLIMDLVVGVKPELQQYL